MAEIEEKFVIATTPGERRVLASDQFELWLARRRWLVKEVDPSIVIGDDYFVAVNSAVLRANILLVLDIAGYCHSAAEQVESSAASVV